LSYESVNQQQEQQPKIEERVYPVTFGCKSKLTAKTYESALNHFLQTTLKNDDLRTLLNTKNSVIESKIIDHITHMKEIEGLTYRSISVHLAAILHFDNNDYTELKRKKLKRHLPEDESDFYGKDKTN
jgi:hypothetical protein